MRDSSFIVFVLASTLLASTLLAGALLAASAAQAQPFGSEGSAMQVGLGAVPGTGVQAVYLQPYTSFTFEAALYADVQAPFSDGGDRRFQAAGAVGGALRILQIARIVVGAGVRGDLDVGLRAGPGLGFKAQETRVDKNQRFRLLLDPFVRHVRRVGPVHLFGEAGLARPRLRAGVWLSF